MIPPQARTALRSAPRAFRASRPQHARRQVRFQSTTEAAQSTASNHTPHLVAGLAGGAGVFLLGYIWYSFSGAKTAIQTANSAQNYLKSLSQKAKSSLPDAEGSDLVKWFRQTAHSYTAMIPGASSYVDSAFDDIEKVRQKHGDEVDQALKDAKNQLVDVTKKDLTFETVAEAWTIISDTIRKITSLAGDSIEDIINNHPSLKEKVGPRINQLKQMGDQYGPEAKKAVDDTWKEVQGVLAGGFSIGTITKIQDLIQRKSDELKKYGDQAWQKGMEQVKPMLDKSPELKKTIEENKDALLKGDLGKLWEQVKKASESGNVDDLKKFVQDQIHQKGGDMRKYADQAWEKGMEQLKPILDKNPEVKKHIEENKEALMKGDVNELWQQAKKATESGDAEKLKKFIQEQVKEYQGLGQQTWDQGMKQVQPILDRVPELKERIEKNKDKLQNINLDELWQQVKKAGEIGNTAPLEKYLKEKLK